MTEPSMPIVRLARRIVEIARDAGIAQKTSPGVVATITSVNHEAWEGNPPPPVFEPDGVYQVGDSFKLEFVDDNLLRATWLGRPSHLNGQGNPYWCNPQTSGENIGKYGA